VIDELKKELRIDARRHSTKLVGKIIKTIPDDFRELVEEAVHQEVLYATMDGYRTTMRHLSETETDNDENFNR